MMSILQFAAVYMVAGLAIALVIAQRSRCSAREMRWFIGGLVFRAGLTVYYWHFTMGRSADARKYFHYADRADVTIKGLFSAGTSFLNNFTALLRPFADVFDNPYLMMYVPYALLGYIGSIFLYLTLRPLYAGVRRKRRNEPLLLAFFLPNLIFWTSNLGKDSLAFFGICAITYAVMANIPIVKRGAIGAIGAIPLYLARPHVMLFMVSAFTFGYFAQRGAFTVRKGIVFAAAFAAFAILFEPVSDYVGLRVEVEEDASAGSVMQSYYDATMARIDQSAEKLATGGAATGRTSANPVMAPVYFVQFLLGPFLWQARKPIQMLSAIENIVYQLMFLYMLVKWKALVRAPFLPFKVSWILFILLAGTVMGMTYTNFGLTVRQKCMILPSLILLYAAARTWLESQRTKQKVMA